MLLSYDYCYEEEEGADRKLLMPMPLMPKRNALLLMPKNNDPWMKKSIRKIERIPEMPENHNQ